METSPATVSAPTVFRIMLQAGLRIITGNPDRLRSLGTLIPRGPVGIKINCLARRNKSAPGALVQAAGDLLVESGRQENDIVVWERTNRELQAAGFKLNASSFGRRCLGTDTDGIGYGDRLFVSGEVGSLVSRVLTDLVKSNINMPALKDHSLAGMSGALKNMYGAIHNPNKYHDNNCSPLLCPRLKSGTVADRPTG